MTLSSPDPAPTRRAPVPADERRKELLEAAARLFAANGFAATRTRAIADACGVSEAILFRHFRSKDELFVAVLEERIARVNIQGFLDELPADLPLEQVFQTIALRILEIGREDPIIHPLLVGASVAGTERTQSVYVQWRLPFVAYLEDVIRRATEAGTLRAVDPRLSARAFVGMVMDCVLSCELWKDLGYGGYTPAELVSNNVPTFVRGLLADRHEPEG